MDILAVLFVFFFDLVLVAGFRVFHRQLSDRFYKRCAIAFSFEALSTLMLLLLSFEEWQYLSYAFLFDLQCIKGLMLLSAIRSLDNPKSQNFGGAETTEVSQQDKQDASNLSTNQTQPTVQISYKYGLEEEKNPYGPI